MLSSATRVAGDRFAFRGGGMVPNSRSVTPFTRTFRGVFRSQCPTADPIARPASVARASQPFFVDVLAHFVVAEDALLLVDPSESPRLVEGDADVVVGEHLEPQRLEMVVEVVFDSFEEASPDAVTPVV